MKITYHIYLVKDSYGNTDYGVVKESSDTIQISGMMNSANEPVYFESDAYHLQKWTEDNGLEFSSYDRDETIIDPENKLLQRMSSSKPRLGDPFTVKDGDVLVDGIVLQEPISNSMLIVIRGETVAVFKDGKDWTVDRETVWRDLKLHSGTWIEPGQKPGFHKISYRPDSKTDPLTRGVGISWIECIGLSILFEMDRLQQIADKNPVYQGNNSIKISPDDLDYLDNGIPERYEFEPIDGKTAVALIAKLADEQLPF